MSYLAPFQSYRSALVKLSGVLYLTPSFGWTAELWTAKFGFI